MISPDNQTIDRVIKPDEYAAAGVPRYWLVANDKANAVQMLVLADDGYRIERDISSLAGSSTNPLRP